VFPKIQAAVDLKSCLALDLLRQHLAENDLLREIL